MATAEITTLNAAVDRLLNANLQQGQCAVLLDLIYTGNVVKVRRLSDVGYYVVAGQKQDAFKGIDNRLVNLGHAFGMAVCLTSKGWVAEHYSDGKALRLGTPTVDSLAALSLAISNVVHRGFVAGSW